MRLFCIALALAALCLPAFAGGGQEKPAAQPAPAAKAPGMDWTTYKGTEIRVVSNKHELSTVMGKLQPAFEQKTGIKVNLEIFPENQYREKVRIELMAGNKDLDVFMSYLPQEGALYKASGFYVDLKPFLDSSAFTDPGYGFPGDYARSTVEAAQIDGVQVAIPIERVFAALVFYRKDLFEQYGIPMPPRTMADIENAARIIQEKTAGAIAGIVNRGAGSKATSQFRHVLHEHGGMWNDDSGKPTVNTPEAVAAFEWWGRTLKNYGPKGVLTFDFYETVNEFVQGKAAISFDGGLNPGVIEDPAKSKVVGKVGYAPMVAGPGGPKVREYPNKLAKVIGLAVSSFSTKKEAAWYFVQTMSGREAQLEYIILGKPAARESVWTDEKFLANTNREWAKAFLEASRYSYATPAFAPPSIKDVNQARDIIGKVIIAAITGEDVKKAADTAQAALVQLWEKEKSAK